MPPSLASPALASPNQLAGALFLLVLLCAVFGAVMAVWGRKAVSVLAGFSLCGLGQTIFFSFLDAPLLAAMQGMMLVASLLALLHPGFRKKAGEQEGAQNGKNKALPGAQELAGRRILGRILGLVVALVFTLALLLPFLSTQQNLAPWLPQNLPARLPRAEAFLLPGLLLLFSLLVGIAGHFAMGLPRPAQAPKTGDDAPPEP